MLKQCIRPISRLKIPDLSIIGVLYCYSVYYSLRRSYSNTKGLFLNSILSFSSANLHKYVFGRFLRTFAARDTRAMVSHTCTGVRTRTYVCNN